MTSIDKAEIFVTNPSQQRKIKEVWQKNAK